MSDELSACYAVLEVDRSANADEIREAYLDLVKVWHPDRFQDETLRLRLKVEEKLKAVNRAYELLRSGAPAFRPASVPNDVGRNRPANGNLRPVNFGGVWGYVETEGRVVIPPRFQQADMFAGGLALVLDGSYYGYIDADGEYAIYPEFARARRFSEGLAAVVLNVHWGFVDRTGRFRVNPEFDDCGDFSEGLAAVHWRGRWGFVNREGQFVIRPRYSGARAFQDGWADVKLGQKWGRVDRSGDTYVGHERGWLPGEAK